MMTTRRGWLTTSLGLLAAAKTSASDLLSHKVLRRPYVEETAELARPGRLWDVLLVDMDAISPVRVRVDQEGNPEPVLEATLLLKGGSEKFRLVGVSGLRAEKPVRVCFSSKQKFKVNSVVGRFILPAFRRVDGMIVYNDPFYRTHREVFGFGLINSDEISMRKSLGFVPNFRAKDVEYV